MRIVVVDTEVFKYDWIAIFLDTSTGEWSVFHNDNQGVRDYMSQPGLLFCGYNNKHYDNHVLKAICCGADPTLVKQISDFIIVEERPGWEHWFLRQSKFWFDNFDLMDDTQVGTSLKHIEAHMGWNIEETQVDFNLDRPLTPEEIDSTIFYCKWDVKATAKLLTLRKGYLEAKINVARTKGIPDTKALYMTNARLTAAFLDAVATERYDEREYHYPDNLDLSLIPNEVIQFFNRLRDTSISSKELFNSQLKVMVDGAEAVVGFGGIHHAIPNYTEERNPRSRRIIRNFDVASLYPSLMVNNGYTSRNIPSADRFAEVYHTRLKAKMTGDKHTANTLKLILNTTYGASLATTNPLYDALMGRSVCITGQLYILELAMRYLRECKTVRIIQLNTDGLMISLAECEMDTIYRINNEWQASKNLILEEDKISKIVQKDVNNYVMVFENGKVKTKGAYVTYGIAGAGAFSINNNHTIVKKAVIDYFVNGTPVEDTINGCDDIHEFQIIAKAGGGYKSVFRVPPDFEDRKKKWKKDNRVCIEIWPSGNGYDPARYKPSKYWKEQPFKWSNYDGPRSEVQRVNRVYASNNPNMGTLVKIKPDGTVGKIGGLPDSVIIDNKNRLTLDSVDKSWYINLAKKYIADYLGEETT
jgi:hypothetical protein